MNRQALAAAAPARRRHARVRRSVPAAGALPLATDGADAAADRLVAPVVLEACRRATQRIGGADLLNLGVTSSLRGEGRTAISAGLAMVQWRDHRRRTILADFDLERPSLHHHLGLAAGPGIRELAHGKADLESCLQRIVGDLWLLPAGGSADNPSQVLSNLARGTIMAQLAAHADVIVCDLPPLLESSAGLDAARLCAGVVLVVRAGVTPLPRVAQAAGLLETPPPVILNAIHSSLPSWLRRAIGDWA